MMKEMNEDDESKIELYFIKHFWIVLYQLLEETIPEVKKKNIKVNNINK